MLTRENTIGVVGAGTMGTGIAQTAATYGHHVVLHDIDKKVLDKSKTFLGDILHRQIEKERMTKDEADAVLGNITFTTKIADLSTCTFVIEAVIEQIEEKQKILRKIEELTPDEAILATNTSSISIASLSSALYAPEYFIGTHFFNPAPLIRLVEIIPGIATGEWVTEAVRNLIDGWGKTTVLAKDTPGFIVNRVARPFYSEALRQLEEGVADAATIDWAMKEIGGFKMGPFELMDFIGNDVNYTVTEKVFEAFYYDPRFKPSFTQKRLFEAGFLGRKSGRGFYDYTGKTSALEPVKDLKLGHEIVNRILVMLINEAIDAVFMNVASPTDIDLAMTLGVNYPRGLLKWANELGLDAVLDQLEQLQAEYGEDRYRPNPLLRRMVHEGRHFVLN